MIGGTSGPAKTSATVTGSFFPFLPPEGGTAQPGGGHQRTDHPCLNYWFGSPLPLRGTPPSLPQFGQQGRPVEGDPGPGQLRFDKAVGAIGQGAEPVGGLMGESARMESHDRRSERTAKYVRSAVEEMDEVPEHLAKLIKHFLANV